MRILRILAVTLAVIINVSGGAVFFAYRDNADAPVITCTEESTIVANVSVTDEELLKYVTAYDNQDGDLTERIQVVRKNMLIQEDPGATVVTFSVCDDDYNVSSITRKLVMTDYYSPRIHLNYDFVFPSGYSYKLTKYVTADDAIDGDITKYIKIISSSFSNVEGEYPIVIKVSNSLADTTELTVNAIVTDRNYFDVKIKLSDYLRYIKVGEEIDYKALMTELINKTDNKYSLDDVVIDTSKLDVTKAGTYDVFYRLIQGNNVVTMSRLIVVVEG